ncbi:putative bifunctional diguanylate cyclase/phosphodiesterase [Devosia sediminis]|uniref:EAL domain-containing protein n=1 Tax=Devosia sediminis TaxID=2798801 RepID=A0A934MM02_9HYPH|nr:EAL domain-containing protein [Devosia sediminis]MBJ3785191.1 EAL domain-containing protein [Devosia sediminis]
MSVLRRITGIFSEPPNADELALAQWSALSRQVPLMYAMLVSNSLILAWTHYGVAPVELTLYVPAVLVALSILRTTLWWIKRHRLPTADQARANLRSMIWVGAALALGFTAWSFALFPFGDAYLKSQIAFYMGITTIGCMFCLMHVRTAALAVGMCVLVPFTAFFVASGQDTLIAIAINMALAVAALLIILLGNNRDFADLVASRGEMAQRQAETQRLLEENHRLANIDSLTGIPNRRSFERELVARLEAAQAQGQSITVARIDIDNFRSVNEVYGQITGDLVLAELARRLAVVKRGSSFLARLDGDNFALIMSEVRYDKTGYPRCAQVITDALRPSFDLPLGVVRITASMGMAASRPGDTAESLFDHADYATWIAKRDTRGGCIEFDDSHLKDLRKTRHMEHLLHTADLDEEIYILLQPQFDVSLGETTGFEVLARWRSPILGEVSPVDFIPMAERTGQVNRVTQAVLRKAIAVGAQLPRSIRLSVNLSANDIGSTSAIEKIVAIVGASPTPTRIDFEITETAVMRDLKQANQSLLVLLGLGARIALDDFGTGHSSLTHVQKLPLHRIKIDRSFVAEVNNDPASRAIVKTMIDLCRNLGISCVFEGIETEEQLRALVALGGSVMQGYLFGRPMTADQVADYLKRERGLKRLEGRAAS